LTAKIAAMTHEVRFPRCDELQNEPESYETLTEFVKLIFGVDGGISED
jgi:hypothetical protein